MVNVVYKGISLMLASMFLCAVAAAQDTVWVRSSAPSPRETYSVCFSENGDRVFSGSECSPSYLRIFSTADGSQLWHYELGNTLLCVSGVKFSSNSQYAAAMEEMGNLLVFDYTGSTPTLIQTIATGTSGAFALDFSPDNTRIVTGCTDKKMIIYRVSDGMPLHNVIAHNAWVMSVDWSPKGGYIATGGNDNTVKLWDSTGTAVRTMIGHTGAVQTVKFTPDGNYIISGGKDDKIKIWETATGNLVRTLQGHTGDVMQVDISDDATKIVSGSADSSIRIWDFSTGTQIMSFRKAGKGTVFTVDFSPNNQLVAAGTANGDVQLWDITHTTGIQDAGRLPEQIAISPNPSHGIFTVNDELQEIQNLSVLDASGKIVWSERMSAKNHDINISHQPNGLYWIVATTASGEAKRFTVIKQ